MLSGFLITGILFDTRTALNRGSSFYGRRILRIFPVYYLAIALFFFLEAHSLWARQALNLQVPADHLSYLFYFQNWLPLWHHGEYPESIISHFWSLAVEEQFYLVWPIVVWHISQRSVARLCGLALILSLIVRTALVAHYGSGIWVYAFTITRSDGLWVGSGLAALYALHGQISSRTLRILGGIGLLCLGAIVVLRPINQLWLTGTYMSMVGITGVACLSGALLVLALRPKKTRLGGLFADAVAAHVWQVQLWHVRVAFPALLLDPAPGRRARVFVSTTGGGRRLVCLPAVRCEFLRGMVELSCLRAMVPATEKVLGPAVCPG